MRTRVIIVGGGFAGLNWVGSSPSDRRGTRLLFGEYWRFYDD